MKCWFKKIFCRNKKQNKTDNIENINISGESNEKK